MQPQNVTHSENYYNHNHQLECVGLEYWLFENYSWPFEAWSIGIKLEIYISSYTIEQLSCKIMFWIQILGAIAVGILAYYYHNHLYYHAASDLFFLLMSVAFVICTFCLLLACVVSWSTGGLISKTMFVRIYSRLPKSSVIYINLLYQFQELIYHAVATILLLAASLTLLIKIGNYRYNNSIYNSYMTAAVRMHYEWIFFIFLYCL